MKREPRIGMRKRRQGSEQALAVKFCFGGGSCLADSGSSLLKFSLLLFYLIFPSSLFFHFNCLFSSSLLLSSLVVASMYSLLFLSSFRLWGVFHRLSLRSPPLTDPVLPYLSLSHWRVSFFLFLICYFLFFISKNKTKNQL